MSHKYHLTYTVQAHPGGLSADEIPPDTGACNAAIIISLLFPEDGSYSHAVFPFDGRNGEESVPGRLSPQEEFKAWQMWALQLAKTLPPGGKQQLVQLLFETAASCQFPDFDVDKFRKQHGLESPDQEVSP